jgi:hypothetical protein
MPALIPQPTRITAAGNKPKLIDGYVGRMLPERFERIRSGFDNHFHLRSRSCTLVSNVRDGAISLSFAISDNPLSIPA